MRPITYLLSTAVLLAGCSAMPEGVQRAVRYNPKPREGVQEFAAAPRELIRPPMAASRPVLQQPPAQGAAMTQPPTLLPPVTEVAPQTPAIPSRAVESAPLAMSAPPPADNTAIPVPSAVAAAQPAAVVQQAVVQQVVPVVAAIPVSTGRVGAAAGETVASTAAPRAAKEPSSDDERRQQNLYLDVIAGLQQQGLHRAALAHLDDFEKANGRSPRTALMRADALAAVGDFDAAEPLYTQLVRTPLAGYGHAGIGYVEGARDRWPLAQEAFIRSVRTEPTNPRFLNNLGFAQLRNGDVAGARATLLRAEELDPGNPGIRNNVILALWTAGDRDGARRRIAGIQQSNEREAIERVIAANTAGAPAEGVAR